MGYRDNLADDVSVTWLDDYEEQSISDIWLLSLESSMNGAVCNYVVIKDCTKKYNFDCLEVYGVCKILTNIINENK